MNTLLALVTCFVATASFIMLFDAPRRAVVYCGITGTIAYGAFLASQAYGTGPVVAAFLGSTLTGAVSEYLARRQRMPAIVFITAGIIPLVPGASAYYAMYYFSLGSYQEAIISASMVLYIASAISAGLAVGAVLRRRVRQ
ncbi:MAG TPA: threonine/serine exporter family protein [Bacillota bacterium]|nr:threonine/serine exporter family protein [Bacillota bacterium]